MAMRTCLIIPCYNEEKRIQLADFEQFVNAHAAVFLYFVDDGSSDHTERVLKQFASRYAAQVKVQRLAVNVGKAEAIRQAVVQVASWQKFDYIGYFDADLATPLSEVLPMIELLDEKPQLQLVMGSRMKRMGAVVERNELRHYIGRIFATFASIILKLPVYDTQCGAKLFREVLVPIAFQEKFYSKWLFDVEVLARMIQHNGREQMANLVFEYPLKTWVDRGDSRIRFTDMVKVPVKLIQLYWCYFR